MESKEGEGTGRKRMQVAGRACERYRIVSTEEILGSWAEHARLEVEFRETTPVAWECRKMSGHFQRGDEGRLLKGGDIWILNAGWNFARCKWDKDIP